MGLVPKLRSCLEEGCLLAVNLGDGADTTGAVYGQIAGAYYGMINVPDAWRKKVVHADLIDTIPRWLHALSSLH